MANTALAKTENTSVTYESPFGAVTLDYNTVRDFLVRGQKNAVTEQEIFLFLKLCEAQKLNPFVTGEVYLIKYQNDQPAQTVVGYDTYKRRAEEHPDFFNFESGIVVQDKAGSILHQKGTCLYPEQKLIGGWCKVNKMKFNQIVEAAYKEVSMAEYGKNTRAWKDMPCTMIAKVAIAQALKQAYPTDYEGQYMPEEFGYDSTELHSDKAISATTEAEVTPYNVNEHTLVNNEELRGMFKLATERLGSDGNEFIKKCLAKYGVNNSKELTKAQYIEILHEINDVPLPEERGEDELPFTDEIVEHDE